MNKTEQLVCSILSPIVLVLLVKKLSSMAKGYVITTTFDILSHVRNVPTVNTAM
jgi:hypothetical protein